MRGSRPSNTHPNTPRHSLQIMICAERPALGEAGWASTALRRWRLVSVSEQQTATAGCHPAYCSFLEQVPIFAEATGGESERVGQTVSAAAIVDPGRVTTTEGADPFSSSAHLSALRRWLQECTARLEALPLDGNADNAQPPASDRDQVSLDAYRSLRVYIETGVALVDRLVNSVAEAHRARERQRQAALGAYEARRIALASASDKTRSREPAAPPSAVPAAPRAQAPPPADDNVSPPRPLRSPTHISRRLPDLPAPESRSDPPLPSPDPGAPPASAELPPRPQPPSSAARPPSPSPASASPTATPHHGHVPRLRKLRDRVRRARTAQCADVSLDAAVSPSPRHSPVWQHAYTPNHTRIYYFHRDTREVTWSLPPPA